MQLWYKINIWKKMIFFCFGFFFSIASCNTKISEKTIDQSLWYTSAEKYIEADKTMVNNGVNQKPTFLDDLNIRSKAENDLLNAPDPTEIDLENLLQSDNVEQVKIALINIRTKKIYSEKLYKLIAHQYFKYDEFWFRYYTITCFKILDQVLLKKHEDDFLELISKEKSNFLIEDGMSVIIRLDVLKILPFFIDYLINGNTEIRKISMVTICSKGTNKFIEKIKEQLTEKGANDILENIETCIKEKSE